jgi:hypothetical protein
MTRWERQGWSGFVRVQEDDEARGHALLDACDLEAAAKAEVGAHGIRHGAVGNARPAQEPAVEVVGHTRAIRPPAVLAEVERSERRGSDRRDDDRLGRRRLGRREEEQGLNGRQGRRRQSLSISGRRGRAGSTGRTSGPPQFLPGAPEQPMLPAARSETVSTGGGEGEGRKRRGCTLGREQELGRNVAAPALARAARRRAKGCVGQRPSSTKVRSGGRTTRHRQRGSPRQSRSRCTCRTSWRPRPVERHRARVG